MMRSSVVRMGCPPRMQVGSWILLTATATGRALLAATLPGNALPHNLTTSSVVNWFLKACLLSKHNFNSFLQPWLLSKQWLRHNMDSLQSLVEQWVSLQCIGIQQVLSFLTKQKDGSLRTS
ncbi:hypothetical protein O6H91_09G040600 [Diphasiastrum complanatum]|uniref:Uncharacterized protein n=1 Tax=Diphasiastrum complanatum TaxID=34168 RepID=A0ACC2CNF8_DIPCM|nr:hypothetical protein O6H91_09G040600 [Diphasiastrum complanatum]